MERGLVHASEASGIVEILERILDKGVVIVGDIRIKIADIELLTISIRLLVASVDKAKEMGIDWWEGSSFLSSLAKENDYKQGMEEKEKEIEALKERLDQLETVEVNTTDRR
ncbi:MAG: gas vesicle protein [bacterium]